MLTTRGYHSHMSTGEAASAPAYGPGHSPAHSSARSPDEPLDKKVITAWSLWNWGNATVSAVMVTFVFGTYLASDVFGPDDRGTQWLTTGNAIAGAIVALTAPVIGQRADRAGRRRLWLTVNTFIVVGLVAACFFVRPEPGFLLLGVTLMASMTLFNEFAELNYNAMITDIADHGRMGRVSGIGWGAGYMGGIVILALVYFGLVAGDPPHWFGLGEDEAINIRMVAVVAAAWFLIWALPLLLMRPATADAARAEREAPERLSIAASYRRLFRIIVGLWKEDRNTFWFLVSSAVYRDGLSAVFTYGAILGVGVYGFSPGDILLFGIAGNVVAALGAFAGGWFDDRTGPRRVIMISVISLVAVATVLYFLDVEREVLGMTLTPVMSFWIFGLALCLFVGPAQASSRAFLGRLAPPDRAGELFGLYATAGRSVSFLTPALISLVLWVFGGQKAIIIGVVAILAAGMLLLLLVHNPTGPARMREKSLR